MYVCMYTHTESGREVQLYATYYLLCALEKLQFVHNSCINLLLFFCSTLEICHFSYPIYYSFLKYLYTDLIEVTSTEEAIGGFIPGTDEASCVSCTAKAIVHILYSSTHHL